MSAVSREDERRRRWRLLLGESASDSLGDLEGDDARMDAAMGALYDTSPASAEAGAGARAAGLGRSAPGVARWLGDIRTYFPQRVVQVMQRDAVTRLGITRLLLEPELLEAVEPDVHLVSTLISLGSAMPEQTKATARQVVRQVVDDIEKRVATRTRAAVTGALNRAARTHRPRLGDVDWHATIRANLAHYLPEHNTIVPEKLIGYGRRRRSLAKEVVLAVDQSGSMTSSVVYASVFGCVLASMPSLRTSMVVFDTAVVDLTDLLADPVDVLFGTQLGGGTDINAAVSYCQGLITRPRDSLFVLVSDLFEGGVREDLITRINQLVQSGVQVLVLLALSDGGAPAYDRGLAADLVELGVPVFACTPDAFPELLSVTLAGGDVAGWAEREELSGR